MVNDVNEFIGLVQPGGVLLIRDPRTAPPWHNLTTLAGYPAGVVDVSLSSQNTVVHVTVNTSTGGVFQTTCTVQPTPGTSGNPAWPGNCTAFINVTPPL
ncbi:hypothetical protein AB0O28_06865 [Microbispora sp. NPDC088329]|uniref:hypothetical protein n=1 Tax=Microbispora sp. NPDC088329 TaxID=3154869 RepID=UPI00343DC19C